MQSGSITIDTAKTRSRAPKQLWGFAISLAAFLTVGACADSTGPVPDLTGAWLGGTPIQLFVAIEQNGTNVTVRGQIAKAGSSDSFLLAVQGTGSIAPDSMVRVELTGQAGHQILEGRLLQSGVISGTLAGDQIAGDGIQIISLTRHSQVPHL